MGRATALIGSPSCGRSTIGQGQQDCGMAPVGLAIAWQRTPTCEVFAAQGGQSAQHLLPSPCQAFLSSWRQPGTETPPCDPGTIQGDGTIMTVLDCQEGIAK